MSPQWCNSKKSDSAHGNDVDVLRTITEPPFCNWTLLIFPCSFLIPLSIQTYQDLGETSMSAFSSGEILPIICCNRLQKVLDLPFCNFLDCWIQSLTMYPPEMLLWCNENKMCFVSGDWNSSGFAQRSSSTGNFALIYWDSYITYRTCNEVDWI